MIDDEIVKAIYINGGNCCEECAGWWVTYICGKCGEKQSTFDGDDDISFTDKHGMLHKCDKCQTINNIED